MALNSESRSYSLETVSLISITSPLVSALFDGVAVNLYPASNLNPFGSNRIPACAPGSISISMQTFKYLVSFASKSYSKSSDRISPPERLPPP